RGPLLELSRPQKPGPIQTLNLQKTVTAYFFGNVEVRPSQRLVLVDKRPVPLGARAFDVLTVLLENQHRMVTKEELLDSVWPGQAVIEHNLVVQVSALRGLLGRESIATVPGRGYRFVAGQPGGGEPSAAPASPPDRAPRTNLPPLPEDLVGRAEDAAMLTSLISRNRLVTVTGAGGVGKSQLAQQLLHAQRGSPPDGVAWVELAGVADGAQVAQTIARALDVQLGSGDSALALTGALAPLVMLIGLDNAEHLVDEVARLVTAILAGAAGVRMVVTSQVPLSVPHENVMRLEPLALPDPAMARAEAARVPSVELFVRRSQARQRDFVLDDGNVSAVIEICRSLDGLPLAIELAAARVPLLGVAGIVQGLYERLDLLADKRRRSPPRQRTLRAALEWSVSLLDAAERRVLRRLGVFAGSFALDMAQQVAADPAAGVDEWAVLDVLGSLVERSLVVVLWGEPPRYRLLESTRALALEQLKTAGETAVVNDRHLDTVLARFSRGYEDREGGRRPFDVVRAWLEPDLDNARSAMRWALATRPQAAVALMVPFHAGRPGSNVSEWRDLWKSTEVLLNSEVDPRTLARWRTGFAQFGAKENPAAALACAQLAIRFFRQHGPVWELCLALNAAVGAKMNQGTATEPEELGELEALVTESSPSSTRYLAAWTRANFLHRVVGDLAGALTAYEKAKSLGQVVGYAAAGWRSALHIADLALLAGDVDAAVRHGEELVAETKPSRVPAYYVMALLNLTGAWLAQGSVEKARHALMELLPLAFHQFDYRTLVSVHLASYAAAGGQAAAAGRFLGYVNARVIATGNRLEGNEAAACTNAQLLAQTQLGEAAFNEALSAGESMSDAEIERLARRVLEAPEAVQPEL
ncbi:MAG TPA: winged helix-turn-helix domain-containing protein, partial [Rubrivivax sp.]|nr:winged helix-turn-helix domain-containing protein [Rubrivivax sp.]